MVKDKDYCMKVLIKERGGLKWSWLPIQDLNCLIEEKKLQYPD